MISAPAVVKPSPVLPPESRFRTLNPVSGDLDRGAHRLPRVPVFWFHFAIFATFAANQSRAFPPESRFRTLNPVSRPLTAEFDLPAFITPDLVPFGDFCALSRPMNPRCSRPSPGSTSLIQFRGHHGRNAPCRSHPPAAASLMTKSVPFFEWMWVRFTPFSVHLSDG